METNKIKKVLIALDYDPTAQKVAEEGFLLAKSMDAEIVLIHVIADPIYYVLVEQVNIMGFAGYYGIDPLPKNSSIEIIRATQQYLDKSKHHLGDTNIKTLVKEGDIGETIIAVAKEMQTDFIIMGSHSRKWVEKIVMGSVTQNVLQNTHIPLYIIPTQKKHHPTTFKKAAFQPIMSVIKRVSGI